MSAAALAIERTAVPDPSGPDEQLAWVYRRVVRDRVLTELRRVAWDRLSQLRSISARPPALWGSPWNATSRSSAWIRVLDP